MTTIDRDTESGAGADQQELMASVTAALAAVHLELDGVPAQRLEFRSWVPRSARKSCQRLFVGSSVDGVPRYVAKIPLDPADRMVAGEWRILSALGAQREPVVPLPRPIRTCHDGFVMSYVPARDLPTAMAAAGPAGWARLLLDAVELAARLHLSGPGCPGVTPRSVVAAFLPDLPEPDGVLAGALERALVGPVHGDFGPWNLQVDQDGRLAAIDWEDYQDAGLPALDVLNVIITAALAAFPEYPEHGFDWLFDQVFHRENAFRAAATSALRRYARLTGQRVDDIVQLLPLFCRWMIHRIEKQHRPTGHLFYGPFAARFQQERTVWHGGDDD